MTSSTGDESSGEMKAEPTAPRAGEPNAQNSELDPSLHPSGARIEAMMGDAADRPDHASPSAVGNAPSRTLVRDWSGENRYVSPEDPSEGARGPASEAPHRMDADHRDRT